jgi:hypothetical protein
MDRAYSTTIRRWLYSTENYDGEPRDDNPLYPTAHPQYLAVHYTYAYAVFISKIFSSLCGRISLVKCGMDPPYGRSALKNLTPLYLLGSKSVYMSLSTNVPLSSSSAIERSSSRADAFRCLVPPRRPSRLSDKILWLPSHLELVWFVSW